MSDMKSKTLLGVSLPRQLSLPIPGDRADLYTSWADVDSSRAEILGSPQRCLSMADIGAYTKRLAQAVTYPGNSVNVAAALPSSCCCEVYRVKGRQVEKGCFIRCSLSSFVKCYLSCLFKVLLKFSFLNTGQWWTQKETLVLYQRPADHYIYSIKGG